MRILVVNGSPKGDDSITVHTAKYLEALHREHEFRYLPAAQRIRSYEKDFGPVASALEWADLILFSYPVYTFIVPFQLHRFMELILENDVDISGRFASQISTSKHFYDVTAHRFMEENCLDLGLRVIRGLSADMEDLLCDKGRREAEMFFDQLMFSCSKGLAEQRSPSHAEARRTVSMPPIRQVPKKEGKEVVIVCSYTDDDRALMDMIACFRALLPYGSHVVNLRRFPFQGGCLGCFGCAVTGSCVYKDGFESLLRDDIQKADAIVYAFTISCHYAHSSFKCYDDRQFCNGHRTVTHGTPVGYLISGDYGKEANLRMILEARCEVGGNYLAGIATDEDDAASSVEALALGLEFAMERHLSRPANFYGVGGMKIFRDLIYVMRGLMKADHRFYRKNGLYDFPQRERNRILRMQLVGALVAIPAVQRKLKGRLSGYIVGPYEKVVAEAGKIADVKSYQANVTSE